MDEDFRKRIQKTLYSGQLECAHNPFLLTEMAVEFFQDLDPNESDEDQVDLEMASEISSQETVSPASTVMSMIYARRLQRKRPDRSRKLSSSDLFLISMMMASKYLYDEGADEEVFNDEWAENAGVDKEDINKMEEDFLDALEWELFIRKEDFEQAMFSIEKSIASKEGLRRGWFSYTDLCLLLEGPWKDLSLSEAARELIKVVVLSTAVYCMAVMGCALMVTAGMTLASSALTSTSLPEPLTTADVPRCMSLDSSPSSCLEHNFSRDISQLRTTDFRNNGVENTLEEGGVSKSHPESEPPSPVTKDTVSVTSPTTSNDYPLLEDGPAANKFKADDTEQSHVTAHSVVDAIVSQLLALLSFKSYLIQFVYAVSEGYNFMADTSQNLSTAKLCHVSAHKCEKSGTKCQTDKEDVNIRSSDWVDKAASPREQGPKYCLYCNRVHSVHKARLNKYGFSLLTFQQLCNRWCKTVDSGTNQPGQSYGWTFRRMRDHPASFQDKKEGTKPRANGEVIQRNMGSVYHLFPDVNIGFSTSMPAPVYAT